MSNNSNNLNLHKPIGLALHVTESQTLPNNHNSKNNNLLTNNYENKKEINQNSSKISSDRKNLKNISNKNQNNFNKFPIQSNSNNLKINNQIQQIQMFIPINPMNMNNINQNLMHIPINNNINMNSITNNMNQMNNYTQSNSNKKYIPNNNKIPSLSSNFNHLLTKIYIDFRVSSLAHVKILNPTYRNTIIPVVPEIFSKSNNFK